jgi:hypothetical protein
MSCIKNGNWQEIPGEHDNVEAAATTTASHIHATSRKSALTVQQLQYYTLGCSDFYFFSHFEV